MIVMNIRVPEEDVAALRQIAKEEERTASQVIRRMISAGLSQRKAKGKGK